MDDLPMTPDERRRDALRRIVENVAVLLERADPVFTTRDRYLRASMSLEAATRAEVARLIELARIVAE